MNRSLTILGYSTRAAAQSAHAAGYFVTAIDAFADADTAAVAPVQRLARWPQGLLTALRAAPPGPWLYTGGLENHPALVAQLAADRPLAGFPAAALRTVRDPQFLRDGAVAAGLNFPATYPSEHFRPQPGDWLWKPRRSAGGVGVRPYAADCPRQGGFVQARAPGTPGSTLFLAAGGGARLLASTEQLCGPEWGAPGPFVYAGSLAPLTLPPHLERALTALANSVVQAGGVGLFGVDWVQSGDQLSVLEVNPRYTASCELLEQISGASLIAWHLQACLGGRLPEEPWASALSALQSAPPLNHGKLTLYARTSGTVTPQAVARLLAWRDAARPLAADIPQPGAPLVAGAPLCTVFAQGTDQADTGQRLRQHTEAALAFFS